MMPFFLGWWWPLLFLVPAVLKNGSIRRQEAGFILIGLGIVAFLSSVGIDKALFLPMLLVLVGVLFLLRATGLFSET